MEKGGIRWTSCQLFTSDLASISQTVKILQNSRKKLYREHFKPTIFLHDCHDLLDCKFQNKFYTKFWTESYHAIYLESMEKGGIRWKKLPAFHEHWSERSYRSKACCSTPFSLFIPLLFSCNSPPNSFFFSELTSSKKKKKKMVFFFNQYLSEGITLLF